MASTTKRDEIFRGIIRSKIAPSFAINVMNPKVLGISAQATGVVIAHEYT